MSWWQALILGIVEGLTEYLPVSSTGHLILTAWLLGLSDDPGLWAAVFTFEIVIQSGAIAAVLLLYRERCLSMVAGVLGKNEAGRRLALRLLVAFLPAAVVGLLLNGVIEERLNGPWPVVFALFAGAWLMLGVVWLRRSRPEDDGLDLTDLDLWTALWIGCGQCLAMWPGTSRSMMTIVVALLAGLRARAAAEFSFLLGLITLSAATIFKFVEGGEQMFEHFGVGILAIGLLAATLSAMLAVRWFVSFLERRGLAPFAWYRLAVAILLAAALVTGWLEAPAAAGYDAVTVD